MFDNLKKCHTFVQTKSSFLMRITIDIKEDKATFFLELIRSFDYIKVEKQEKVVETPLHIAQSYQSAPTAERQNVVTWVKAS